MDVREFFELSAGKWFSQKTSHHLTLKQSELGKSDLVIDILASSDPQVIQLCQEVGIDSNLTGFGAKYAWKGTTKSDAQSLNTTNQQGAAIAILVPDAPAARFGRLFRFVTEGATTAPVTAQYTLGDDDALNLVTDHEDRRSEERVWFESNNVRLRTTIVTHSNGESLASFYSEIRMGGK